MDRVLAILRAISIVGHPPDDAEPFDLVRIDPKYKVTIDDKKYKCVADMMWICNAHIAMHRNPIYTMTERVTHFTTFKIPENFVHDAPISSMDCRAMFDTLEALNWKLDGNLFCHDERTPEWFAECRRILELLRHRAYYLAINTLDNEVHNMPEYIIKTPNSKRLCVGRESDDELEPEMGIDELEQQATLETTRVRDAFVWDFNSRFMHIDLILHACEGLVFIPAKPLVAAMRQRIADRVNRSITFEPLMDCRMEFEYNLACNEADRRIFQRKEPLSFDASARTILLRKQDSLVDETDIPADIMAYFKTQDKDMYRMNLDAALYFIATTANHNFIDMLVLKNWEVTRPVLTTPRIIRVRARNTWGVVSEWPTVYECNSLVAAYVVCENEFKRKNMPFEMTGPSRPNLPSQRIPLSFEGI